MHLKLLHGIDAFLVTNPTNIRYLTGFVGVEPSEREAYVLLTDKQTYLFTNSMYREQAKKLEGSGNRVQGTDVQFVEISRENPLSKELSRVILNLPACRRGRFQDPSSSSNTGSRIRVRDDKRNKLGFEDTNLTVAELTKLKQVLTGIEFIPIRDRVEKMRMIKRKDEIENIKLAAKITDQCFSYITKRIRPGMTEARLAWEIEGFLRMNAGDVAFSPIVAFNENSSQPHYNKRGNNPLRKNSLILLDFGARVNGYCADMTRVVFLGTPKDEWVKTYTFVLNAQTAALKYLEECFNVLIHQNKRLPISGSKADQISREVTGQAGLPAYPHSLGHAVGLDIHEAPRLTVKKDEKLESDMIVTVEPGVYIEGSYGIRIEDLVLLKSKSIEMLSKSQKEIIVL